MKITEKLKDFKLDWAKHKWYIIISSVVLLALTSIIIIYGIVSSDDGKDEGFAEIPPIKFKIDKTIHGKINVYGRRNENAYIILSNKNGRFLNELFNKQHSTVTGSYISGIQKLKINFLIFTPPIDNLNKGFIMLDCEYSDENGLGHYFFSGKIAEW